MVRSFAALLFCGTALYAAPASALDTPGVTIAVDGVSVDLQTQDVPRRAILEQLFAGRGVALEWRDGAFADEPVTGTFRGTLTSVTRQLLGQSNYVMSYAAGGNERRPTKIVIMGRAKSGGERLRPPGVADSLERPKANERTPVAVPATAPQQPAAPAENTPTRLAAGPQVAPSARSGVAPAPTAGPQPDSGAPVPQPLAVPNAGAPVPVISPQDGDAPMPPLPQLGAAGSNPLPVPTISSDAAPVLPVPGSMPSGVAIPMPAAQSVK